MRGELPELDMNLYVVVTLLVVICVMYGYTIDRTR